MFVLFYMAVGTALLTIVLALWKGGPAERLGVLSYLVISGLHYMVKPADEFSLSYSYGFLAADMLIAAAFLILALRYSSLWLAGAMIAQGLATGAHGLHLEDEQINQHLNYMGVSVWILANNFFTSVVVWMLLGGTVVSWRKRIRLRRAAKAAKAEGVTTVPAPAAA